jgi:hypothetical protein
MKAPNTIEKARTLLGVAYLFAKLDPLRASEVMSEAIKTTNKLDHPDFTQSSITRAIEGRVFSMFAGYDRPGINKSKLPRSSRARSLRNRGRIRRGAQRLRTNNFDEHSRD